MSEYDPKSLWHVHVAMDNEDHADIVRGGIEEITTLRQQLEQAQARVAELESIFIRQQCEYVKGPDGFETWRDAAVSERAWRASMKPMDEAVDLARQGMDIFTGPNMNERKICAELVRLDEVYARGAQRLRQQADEAERAGGEK